MTDATPYHVPADWCDKCRAWWPATRRTEPPYYCAECGTVLIPRTRHAGWFQIPRKNDP